MNKKADIWVSAVIYIALGITIITILLTAGLPVIEKIRDKNTYAQTKDVMHELDNTIREVYREGPGARRTSLIRIDRGEFTIDKDNDKIIWNMDTERMFSEPGTPPLKEGNLQITTTASNVEGEYTTEVLLDYRGIIDLTGTLGTLSGNYNLLISNEIENGNSVIRIEDIS